MDIIDVMLARALTPQGQIESYAAQAQKAVSNANTAINNISTITEQTNTNNANAIDAMTEATAALEKVNNAMETAEQLISELENTDTIDNEIDKLLIDLTSRPGQNVIAKDLITTYPDGSTKQINDAIKYYTTTGNNEDGTMTQKAITAAIAAHAGQGSSSLSNLGPENAGNIVVIGPDGTIISGETSENAIIEALIKSNSYTAKDAVGLEIDYLNKNFVRTQEAVNLSEGEDFNRYNMYSGRKRCTVANNGRIIAFAGESGYVEDGSNGQVMVYQPKFYYQRVPITLANATVGKVIRKESIIISPTEQTGFKLHPIFIGENGEELDYVLLSAYESCAFDVSTNNYDLNDGADIDTANDLLSSIAGAKPISGANKNFNIVAAEQMARNRGTGWHIMNMAAESALQFLEIVEFGTLNGQNALELGISNIPNNATANCASITGSTSSLRDITGYATETRNETAGVYNIYSENGRRAISYRGMENPWGNIWRMVGGINIVGNGSQAGGIPHICTNFNYDITGAGENYNSLSFCIPSVYDYISGFGYDSNYDWVFIPAECSGGNSALPVGDQIWTSANLNGLDMVLVGGSWAFQERNGIFAYGFDQKIDQNLRSFSARLMYIPQKNSIYNANINKWKTSEEA